MTDLIFLTATELVAAIRTRQVSAVDVLDAYLKQIAAHNPKVNAVITLDEERARQRAVEADAALARGEIWGPLHGLPITVKDALETAGLRTTSSFKPLAHYIPKQDATAVARLRSAGAIVLGKTNLPELANGPQVNSPLFGTTNNPWDLSRTPGGSSGGSAAAIAAGFSALELGSDIGGSVRLPAHFCGIFSIKPTDYLVSTVGHIPPPPPTRFRGLLQYLLSVGPLARSIADLKLALSLIAGPDINAWQIPPVSLAGEPPRPLREQRFAWSDDFGGFPISDDTRTALTQLADNLTRAGCRVERCNPPGLDFRAAVETNYEIQMSAFMVRGTPLHLPRTAFRWLAQRMPVSEPVARGGLSGTGATLKQYAAALARREGYIYSLEQFLANYDAWLCPVASVPAFRHTSAATIVEQIRATVDLDGQPISYLNAANMFTSIFNLTGNPAVVVPVARSKEGLPIGVQVVGRRWADMTLLNIAEALTEVTGPFRPPAGY